MNYSHRLTQFAVSKHRSAIPQWEVYLKLWATGSFETLTFIYKTTQRHMSQYRNVHIHQCGMCGPHRNKLCSYETIVLFRGNLQTCHFVPEFQTEKPLYFIPRDEKLQRNHPHPFSFSFFFLFFKIWEGRRIKKKVKLSILYKEIE
jgi:hypothetical protein